MAVQGNEHLAQQRYDQIEDVFFQALDTPKSKRQAWLIKHCADDNELLDEVNALLKGHEVDDGFLETQLDLSELKTHVTQVHAEAHADSDQALDQALLQVGNKRPSCPNLVGRTLGHYHVIQQIDKGGMGRVYLAKRDDGEYDKIVAVKVVEVQGIEAELFRKERQILANFEHPNIVTLFDGGTLPEGFPYLVMEYIDGSPIDHFTTDNRYNARQIVQLCTDLCKVVNKSHQHGVIHCDIKPANILVTHTKELKLLDFGIAQSLVNADSISNNNFSAFALTPEYASPQRHEQKTPHVADDIYSIGVILGQLLCNAPLPKIEKKSRLKKIYQAADIDTLAKAIHSLELRSIFLKATNEQTEDRYSSADAFKHDLENWLHNKPVRALGDDFQYRSIKHVNRQWKWWGLAALIAVLAYQPISYYQQQKQEKAALNLAILEAKGLVLGRQELFQDIPNNISVHKEILQLGAERLAEWHKRFPQNSELATMLAKQYSLLASVTGHPFRLNAGETLEAQDHYRKAQNLLEAQDSSDAALALIDVKHQLAATQIYTGSYGLGLKALEKLLASIKTPADNSAPSKKILSQELPITLTMIDALILQYRFAEARDYLNKAKQLSDKMAYTFDTKERITLKARLVEQELHLNYLAISTPTVPFNQSNPLSQNNLATNVTNNSNTTNNTEQNSLTKSYYQNKLKPLANEIYVLTQNIENNDINLLKARAENTLGCAELYLNNPHSAEQHLDKIQQHFNRVAQENVNLIDFNQRLEILYNNPKFNVATKLQCNRPLAYLYPRP